MRESRLLVSVSCFHAVKMISPVCMYVTLLFYAGAHIKAGEKRTHAHQKPATPRAGGRYCRALESLSFRRTNILNPCEITLLRLLREIFQFRPRVSSFRGAGAECRRSLWAGGRLPCKQINELGIWLKLRTRMATQLKLYRQKFCSVNVILLFWKKQMT